MASKPFKLMFGSTIFKKIIMAITGLFLTFFVLIHMTGNLSFVFGGKDVFNIYSHTLISLGPLLWTIETVLLLAFIFHAWNAISISLHNKKARPASYTKLKSSGDPSKKTLSSTTLIWTGIVLLVFIVIHLKTFKYGAYYSTTVNGVEMRNLYQLVKEVFQSPFYTFGYVATMLLLGYHLRHGFWSAFQSLGANHPRYSNIIYTIGILLAVVIAFGFLVVPLYVFFS